MANQRLFDIIQSPLPDGDLLPTAMTVVEELGRPFEIQLEMMSPKPDLPFEKLLGEQIALSLDMGERGTRHFNGFVSRFSLLAPHGRFTTYSATLRPWLWFLTRTATSRIFQELTAPQIISKVLKARELGESKEDMQDREYKKRSYCVQYRETDFAFLSRLMEQEGIFYFFDFAEDKHTLVVTDKNPQDALFSGFEKVPFVAHVPGVEVKKDHLFDWTISKKVQPGTMTLNDFDFKNPKSPDRLISETIKRQHSRADFEVYDFPGKFFKEADGHPYAKMRIQEAHAQHETIHALGQVRGVSAGSVFELEGHPRDDQARKYLVTSSMQAFRNAEFAADLGLAVGEEHTTSLVLIDVAEPFRPARLTEPPIMPGLQTATVVGESDSAQVDEVVTDPHGRVKVRFHWVRDKEHETHEDALSCWIRVAQIWAGPNWGAQFIPRVGHEVVVDFIEGDPDRPLIVGSVYNEDNKYPYTLPANKTQSGIKSRSTTGGTDEDFNELRFEDKAGEEQVYFHAQKDYQQVIEKNRTESVGVDRSLSVGHDKSESITNNKTITVGVDHTETIGANKTMTVGANHVETITGNKTMTVVGTHTETITGAKTLTVAASHTESIGTTMTLSVLAARADSVGGAYNIAVGGAMSVEVGGLLNESVGGLKSESVGASKSVSVGSKLNQEIGGDKTENIGGKYVVTAGGDAAVKAKKIVIEADDEITLKSGSATVVLKKSGDIEIKGTKVKVEASGDLILKGSNIVQN